MMPDAEVVQRLTGAIDVAVDDREWHTSIGSQRDYSDHHLVKPCRSLTLMLLATNFTMQNGAKKLRND